MFQRHYPARNIFKAHVEARGGGGKDSKERALSSVARLHLARPDFRCLGLQWGLNSNQPPGKLYSCTVLTVAKVEQADTRRKGRTPVSLDLKKCSLDASNHSQSFTVVWERLCDALQYGWVHSKTPLIAPQAQKQGCARGGLVFRTDKPEIFVSFLTKQHTQFAQ